MITEISHPNSKLNERALQIIGPLPLSKTSFFSSKRPSVLVDGGVNHDLNIETQLFSIGDGDSLAPEINHTFDVKLNPDKDISDLKAAYDKIRQDYKIFSQFYLLGFSGGDFAHQLCLIQDSLYFLTHSSSPQHVILPPQGNLGQKVIMLSQSFSNPWTIKVNGEFSLINLIPNPPGHNCKIDGDVKYAGDYPLESLSGSQGLHNIGNGFVKIENTFPVMLVLGLELS